MMEGTREQIDADEKKGHGAAPLKEEI